MKKLLLIMLLWLMISPQSYADEISAWGGWAWGGWPIISVPVSWPRGGGGISVPTIDFTLVKQLRFSIFKVFEGTMTIGK